MTNHLLKFIKIIKFACLIKQNIPKIVYKKMSIVKRPSTQFGEPLSSESICLIQEVRRKFSLPIHQNFDSDFNIYRFIANAERSQKGGRKEIVESAVKALNRHLRVRKCLKLDELPDVAFEQNRLFRENFMPYGPILDGTDSQNRLLWFIEYRSLCVETIAHGIRSSESILCQFWHFEHMLRRVNRQEQQTGRLSSIRHIIDMTGYEINPFTMIFVSSGTLSYYSQLLHYDNYPELVYPIEMVNIARWIQIPYRLIKGMMPTGFTDRFRLHDGIFLDTLSTQIPIEYIPQSIGGKNSFCKCIPAQRLLPTNLWQPAHPQILDQLESLQIGPKKFKMFRIQIEPDHGQHILSWYFRTDGDIYFGLFFEPLANKTAKLNIQMLGNGSENNGELWRGNGEAKKMAIEEIESSMDWVYPFFKLTAKLHHEFDCIDCSKPGNYWLIFSNQQSWLHRRNVEVLVHLERKEEVNERERWIGKRIRYDGTEEEIGVNDNLRQTLKMTPGDIYGPKIENGKMIDISYI